MLKPAANVRELGSGLGGHGFEDERVIRGGLVISDVTAGPEVILKNLEAGLGGKVGKFHAYIASDSAAPLKYRFTISEFHKIDEPKP